MEIDNINECLILGSKGRKELLKLLNVTFFNYDKNMFFQILTKCGQSNFHSLRCIMCLFISICDYYQISYADIISLSRKKPLPYARFIYCAITAEELSGISGNKLVAFINKDHCFNIYAKKEIEKSYDIRSELYFDYLNIYDVYKDMLIEHKLNINPFKNS